MYERMVATMTAIILFAAGASLEAGQAERTPAASPKPSVLAGAAKIDITPRFPVRMYGYGSRTTDSEGVSGRLYAKALAIGGNEGEGPAVLLAVDNGAVPEKLSSEVLSRLKSNTNIKTKRFVLCSSHTHSGPNIKGVDSLPAEQREPLLRYRRELIDCLEKVTRRALASRQPVRLAWGKGTVEFAANRRVLKDGKWSGFGAVKDGPVDHSLPLLRVTGSDGKLIAVLVNYACHCTTLRPDFKKIHGDWAGCAQKFIETAHPGAVALISIGCAADADPYPHGNLKLAKQHGRELADEVNRLLKGNLKPVSSKITANSGILKLPYHKPPSKAELQKRVKNSWALKEAAQRLQNGKKPRAMRYRVTTWEFGRDLAMIFLTGEVVVDYAFRLRKELKGRRLWISAYAHGVPCYVISKRVLNEGGYEVRNSISTRISYGRPHKVIPPIEDRIVNQVKMMLGAAPPE